MESYIKCSHVDYVSSRVETFFDVQLNIKDKKDGKCLGGRGGGVINIKVFSAFLCIPLTTSNKMDRLKKREGLPAPCVEIATGPVSFSGDLMVQGVTPAIWDLSLKVISVVLLGFALSVLWRLWGSFYNEPPTPPFSLSVWVFQGLCQCGNYEWRKQVWCRRAWVAGTIYSTLNSPLNHLKSSLVCAIKWTLASFWDFSRI